MASTGETDTAGPPAEGSIDQHDLGRELRTLRRRQHLTLRQVAERAGVTESFLSQAERGLTGMSLPVLQRVAVALDVSVAELFEPDGERRPSVVRSRMRSVMEFEGWRNALLTPPSSKNVEVFWIELEPGGSTADRPFSHGASEEVLVLVSGRLEVRVSGASHELAPGDAITYSSSVPHVATNVGDELAEAIIVLSPPGM
jgi:transcriptional regulator with XRE-family HTH domain